MVTRPVFSSEVDRVGVKVADSAPFAWSPGFALAQKQKNVDALHAAIRKADVRMRPLEVSSRSREEIGVRLSAFNLGAWVGDRFVTVESVYQASKVFEGGIGPFPELYGGNPKLVRDKIRGFGERKIVAYQTGDVRWDLTPTRAFYDWVYCRALHKNQALVANLAEFNCFTDIAFNPMKSLNCQAYAIALYLSLLANGVLEEALKDRDAFLKFHPSDVVGLAPSNHIDKKPASRKRRKSDKAAQQEFFL